MSEVAPQKKSLPSLMPRVLSAIAAIVICVAPYYFLGRKGLLLLGFVVAFGALLEYIFVAIKPAKASRGIQFFYGLIALPLMMATVEEIHLFPMSITWGLLVPLYFTFVIWYLRGKLNNDDLYHLIAASGLGFIYCALGPAFTLRCLFLGDSENLFFILLGMVFACDTFAYFGGLFFGRGKMMENISPKKTWAGFTFGIIGSITIAIVFKPFGAEPFWTQALLAIPVSLVSQSGDLFMSLVKRVAQVKDSGFIMPGHGGVLDRLDGLFFASPVYYFLVLSTSAAVSA